MGLFDFFRSKNIEQRNVQEYFKMLTAYSPTYSSREGGLYEMSLTRAAIDAYARHCGKLKPRVTGSARRDLENMLLFQPNDMMDTYTFLYKLATIVKVENTAFIIPILDSTQRIIGYYPQRSIGTEVKVINGKQYLIYPKGGSQKLDSIEFSRVGVVRNHVYRSDLYGEGTALGTTMDMLHTQDQGIINGIKNSANIRFLARLSNVLTDKMLKDERERFRAENLASENNGGVAIFDAKYSDVKPIESKQMLVDDKQQELINKNVYNYLGVNEDILQNKFNETTWDAWYEGAIETFAIQVSLVMTNMTFTPREKANGNSIMLEANRLQYASNQTKIAIVTQLFDRGFISQNEGLEVFNMAPVDDGDKRYIRREYVEVDKLGDVSLAKEKPDDNE